MLVTQDSLEILRGDGTVFPGFPVYWPEARENWNVDEVGTSLPVIGDVDGDSSPDIVFMTHYFTGGGTVGAVRAYDASGRSLPRFPKVLYSGDGVVPAIADVDLDGRNEIIVGSSSWNGESGDSDKVWVYDLGGPPHGAIEWGQLGGGPRYLGHYPVPDLP